jgi:hypothetical protein
VTNDKAATPFMLVGEGAGVSGPLQRTATTAIGALSDMHALRRLCGRSGQVTVFGAGGRPMTVERLVSMARAEEDGS